MKSNEIRKRFLTFFEKRNHVVIDSASLITEEAPHATNATLFNTAGMQPLIPYLLGEDHPLGKRLASSQKCLRTNDLDEVGDNTHATFFEMLGNWSLGDYFKEDAIVWSYQFLTDSDEGLGLDPARLYITVFSGNEEVPRDLESVEIWKKFIPEKRIYFRDSKDNWWTAGPNSPAGPSTEMFYDLTGNLGDLSPEAFEQADEDQKLVEIWNDVFMTFQLEDGHIKGNLPQKNVDTGSGLERVSAVMQGVSNIFETDLYLPLMEYIKEHASQYQERYARIISDHIKSATFLASEGVSISNTGRGYVLRRILRRIYFSAKEIGFSHKEIKELVLLVKDMYKDLYFKDLSQELLNNIISSFEGEMLKVEKLVEKGKNLLKKFKEDGGSHLEGSFLVNLEQTHGLPLSITKRIAKEFELIIDDAALLVYEKEKKAHQDISRMGAEKKFKGGLEKDTPKIRALHSATHLMLAGLRKFLGESVHQKGSNITEERSRFDFTHPEKVSREILDQVEHYVQEAIESNATVSIDHMKKADAQNDPSVVGSFWEKYPDDVQVYTMKDQNGIIYSRELCGGPHVEKLSEIASFGKMRIVKEEASSAGVRRVRMELQQ